MASVNVILPLIVISSLCFGKSKLPELSLKQRIQSVRFISHDGKFTYYVNSQAKLLLSTNFNIRTVLQAEKGVDFLIYSSPAQKKLLIEQNNSKHSLFGIRKINEIFAIDFGKANPTSIGKGVAPILHFKDLWASFYLPQTKKIVFQNLDNMAIRFQIKLFNKRNPYFIPQVVMLNDQDILFTDLNEKGINGLLRFQRNTGKLTPVMKADDHNQKIELCLTSNDLYLGLFPLKEKGKTIIFKLPLDELNFESPKALYQSNHADIGNMICTDKELYFIKQVITKAKKKRYEVASISKGIVTVLSDLLNASQIINMDGNILVPYRSKFYIIDGNTKLSEDNLSDKK